MSSKPISSLVILFYIVSLWTILSFDLSSCRIEIAKNNVRQLVKSYNNTLPNISIQNLDVNGQSFNHHTGYYPIKHSYDARMFYFFCESRGSKSDPVILWLTGGPAVGSLVALFHGPGPLRIYDDLSLKWNDFGWDIVSNILFVDQPINTGFSYSSDDRDIRHDTNEVSSDLYDFLQAFFQDHPEFLKNDFYIAGSSYSGHTIPALASRLVKENEAKRGIHINLKGLVIGNGFINPEYMYSSYHDFALANKLISKSSYNKLKRLNVECLKSIQPCQTDDKGCGDSYQLCRYNFELLMDTIFYKDPYNIGRNLTNRSFYDVSRLSKFLALDYVKNALGVGSREYIFFNHTIHIAMINDRMKNYATNVSSILENGIKVLIYDGEYDMMCNWFGNLRWLNSIKWSGQGQFLKSKLTSYKVDGKKVGQIKHIGPLTYLKVHNSGHCIFFDQPNVALQMLKNWIDA